mmetsp:Transcript_26856/g.75962  ORF Transcript_26856/g.75962 Transcript_26856/m.75962 type:complete len:266 (+) Transcript_26856:71-868(+)
MPLRCALPSASCCRRSLLHALLQKLFKGPPWDVVAKDARELDEVAAVPYDDEIVEVVPVLALFALRGALAVLVAHLLTLLAGAAEHLVAGAAVPCIVVIHELLLAGLAQAGVEGHGLLLLEPEGDGQPLIVEFPGVGRAPERHPPGGPHDPARLHHPPPVPPVPPYAVRRHVAALHLRAHGARVEAREVAAALRRRRHAVVVDGVECPVRDAYEPPPQLGRPLAVQAGEHVDGPVWTEPHPRRLLAPPPRVGGVPRIAGGGLEAK